MKKSLYISLLFLTLLLWGTTLPAAPLIDTAEEPSSIRGTDGPATYPAHLPGGYGAPFQAEIIGFSGKTAQAASPEDPQSSSSDHAQHKRTLGQPGYPYTIAAGSLQSARIKKLIFPFHSYL